MFKLSERNIFVIMTFMAIVAILIESMIQISFLIFIVCYIYLGYKSRQHKEISLTYFDKGWLWVSLAYAGVFLLSFLLRMPYTNDGIWRISSPLFIVLLSGWFFISIKHGFESLSLKIVAFSIISLGLLILLVESTMLAHAQDIFDSSYKLGSLYADYGATGFIIPLGAAIALVLASRNSNQKFWWLMAIVGLILVLLIKKRTPLVMYIVTLFGFVGWAFFHAKFLEMKQKITIVVVFALLVTSAAWVQRDTIKQVVTDYNQAVDKGNLMTSLGLRYQMAEIGVDLIKKKPLLGWGPGYYKEYGLWPYVDSLSFPEGGKSLLKSFTQLHNQYLMDWVLSGIFGLISLLVFLLYPLFVFIKWLKVDPLQAWVSIGMMGGVYIVMFFGALFTYTYTTIAYMLVVSSLISWASKRIRSAKNNG